MSNKFAVFDIDGTLVRWQLYHAVVDRLAKQGLLGESAHSKLHDARMVWKRREYKDSFKDYEKTLIDIYEQALTNITTEAFDQIADQIAKEYKDQVYTFTRDLVADLKQKDYTLLAISGSHKELVGYVARNFGFADWVGTEYERKGDRFTGEKFVASQDKKAILESLVKKHNLTYEESYAVGDSLSDEPMLGMVKNPIAFNPDQQLFNAAKQRKWTIVAERKNVVYELRSNNGKYVLA